MEEIILVDFDDQQIGTGYKQEVHEKGLLHRAFSIFLFNKDKLLIHQRAFSKYHCGGLWTNTCCSHPRINETLEEATKRRLLEETGIECEIKEVDSFIYCAHFNNGLTEYEIDHVFVGEYDGEYIVNPEEIQEMKYISIDELKKDMILYPKKYTPWFFTALNIALRGRN